MELGTYSAMTVCGGLHAVLTSVQRNQVTIRRIVSPVVRNLRTSKEIIVDDSVVPDLDDPVDYITCIVNEARCAAA